MASILKDSQQFEICNVTDGIGKPFRIRAPLHIYKPPTRCIMIHIPGEGLIQAKVQYESSLTFYHFCGKIGHR